MFHDSVTKLVLVTNRVVIRPEIDGVSDPLRLRIPAEAGSDGRYVCDDAVDHCLVADIRDLGRDDLDDVHVLLLPVGRIGSDGDATLA